MTPDPITHQTSGLEGHYRGIVFGLMALGLVSGCSASAGSEEAENVEVVLTQHSEIWSAGNTDLVEVIYSEDFLGHFPAGPVRGRDGITDRVLDHRTAFPDWTEEVVDVVTEGDRVVTRFISRGTNLGPFLGNPATGRQIEISEVAIYQLEGGQIVEQWVYPDMRAMQEQLGMDQ